MLAEKVARDPTYDLGFPLLFADYRSQNTNKVQAYVDLYDGEGRPRPTFCLCPHLCLCPLSLPSPNTAPSMRVVNALALALA